MRAVSDVCVSRYNERERICVKIKNWASCIPEELRKNPYTSPVIFEKAPHSLRLFASPFITGARASLGPGATGGLIEGRMQAAPGSPTRQPAEDEEEDRPAKRQRVDGLDGLLDRSSPPLPAPTIATALTSTYAPSPMQFMQSAQTPAPTLANPGATVYASTSLEMASQACPSPSLVPESYPGLTTMPSVPILPAMAQSPYASPYQRSPAGYVSQGLLQGSGGASPHHIDASRVGTPQLGVPGPSQMQISASQGRQSSQASSNRGLATQMGGRERMLLLNEVEELGQPLRKSIAVLF